MNHSHPHWLRSAIIAGIGLLIALISVLWVGIAIRSVGPKTLSLSYRIDDNTTLAFARTTNKEDLERSIRTLDAIFESERSPDLRDLPDGISYEVALVSGSKGRQAWFIDVHQKNQEEKLLMSENDASLLLPLTRIKESLGASVFFRRYEKNNGHNIVHVNLARVPALTASSSGLLSAGLQPFSEALIIEKNATEHEWILLKKEASLFTTNTTLIPIASEDASLLTTLSLGNPATFASALDDALKKRNPALREGIIGIALQQFNDITHRNDMKQSLHDLAANGGNFTIHAGSGASLFRIVGIATSAQEAKKWSALVHSSTTQAFIRTLDFLHGDRRTDVVATPDKGVIRKNNGWEILSISSGNTMQLSVATKDRTILIANDATLLRNTMTDRDHPVHPIESKRGLFTANINRAWLLEQLQANIFTTQQELRLLQSIIDPHSSRLLFHALDERDVVNVRFRIE